MIESYINSGKSCCFFVTSDCKCITSNSCMIQYECHNNNEKNYPQETDRDILSAGLNLEDTSEPSSRSCCCRPRDSESTYDDGTKSTSDHTSTKCCQECRQIHDCYQYTIQNTNQHSKNNCCKDTNDCRHSFMNDQISTNE